ncbi:LPXTG cell wall anchor domain-containing protein [Bacillus sp. MRMR6]|uniref:LPXTG cell wall anchor domain-containing protein n=1 Tax=Bacillus sp. MRMR6 TaxID=1928617 RepID=UPI000950E3E8|nr:LPXTG cell wall anchor domain-containing protein [Bacillus sp. MRMR6]OLS33388.1 hypothetical protein BTR25_26125 [Bacillus sp. MRMR6]
MKNIPGVGVEVIEPIDDNETPDEDPQTPEEGEDTQTPVEDNETTKGHELPNSETSIYNYLVLGFLLLISGLFLKKNSRKAKNGSIS